MRRSILAVAVLLLAGRASAQPAEVDAGTPAAETPATPPPDAPAAPSAQEQVDGLGGRLGALEESYAETKTSVLSMSKLKLSGYIQGRYVYNESSRGQLNTAGTSPTVNDGFNVRRGRLKATYTGTIGSAVIQIDAVPRGVTLKDAEAILVEPWTGAKLTLTVGQTKWPFGYEVVQSSGDREFPERTRVVRAFFPGERDRGAKLTGKFGPIRATVGVFDGNGTDNRLGSSAVIGVDNDTEKDLLGRIAFDQSWIAGGVSGWVGKTFQYGDFSTDPARLGRFHPRNRIGADLQLYLDLLPVGGTAIKGEFIAGRTYQVSSVERFNQAGIGWYALLVQNLGDMDQIAARYDYFDGAAGVPPTTSATSAETAVGTFGILLMHHFDEVLKATLTWEMPMAVLASGGTDVKDNMLTFQLQAKF